MTPSEKFAKMRLLRAATVAIIDVALSPLNWCAPGNGFLGDEYRGMVVRYLSYKPYCGSVWV